MSDVVFAGLSAWYRSAPVPAADQPDFVNAVIALRSDVEPATFLQRLHDIEAEAGRVRSVRNAARVLDLDLLAVDDWVRPGPGLVLPHPRLAERAFVLYPLCDVAPGWRHPVLGRTAAELLAELADQRPEQRITRLPDEPADLLLRARVLI